MIPTRTYRGKDAQTRRAERRRRMLDAALEEFGTNGYAATSVAAVCRRSGLSSRQFYEVFDNRESLLRTLYDEIQRAAQEHVLAVVSAARAHDGGPAAFVDAGVAGFLDYYERDPRLVRVCFIEVIGVSAEFERHRNDARRRWAQRLAGLADAVAEQGLVPRRDYVLDWLVFLGAVNAAVVERTIDPAIGIDSLRAVLTRMITPGVLGTPPVQ